MFSDAAEMTHTTLECISTPTKGRGMVSVADIPPTSLLHVEEPYAAVRSKPVMCTTNKKSGLSASNKQKKEGKKRSKKKEIVK